jgi:hypothetical protein
MPEAKTTSMAKELDRSITIAEVTPILQNYVLAALAEVSKLSL